MINIAHPLVTIGIPTYNRADGYLKEAIQSAMSQKYPNIEVVISDNCSSDNTKNLVKGFSDPRIRYYRHDVNIGANNNFNFCVNQAKGDYFLMLHDDDLIDQDFIDVCMRAANYATNIGIIRTGTRVIDFEGKVLSEHKNMVVGFSTTDFFMGWFACKTSLYLCSTIFNTKRLKEIGGFKSKKDLFQDVMAEVQLAAKFGRVDVEDIKASFRKHDEEITSSTKASAWCEDSLMLLDLMCDLVPENRSMVRNEGARFLSMLNYNVASEVKSPLKRLISYIMVFKSYNYRYLPPRVNRGLRLLKRKIKRVLGR